MSTVPRLPAAFNRSLSTNRQLEGHAIQTATEISCMTFALYSIVYAREGRRGVASAVHLRLDNPLNAGTCVVRIGGRCASCDGVRTATGIRAKPKGVVAKDVATVSVTPAHTNTSSHSEGHVLKIKVWINLARYGRSDDGKRWRGSRISRK